MQKRKWSNSILLLLVIFLLTGCGRDTPEMEFASVDEAKEALNTASTIEIYTDLYSKRRETKILADGKVAGYVKWNTVYIDDQEWFSVDYTSDVKGEKSSTGYGYYDAEGNCLGYAQERYLDLEDGSRDPFLVFLDTDGTMLDYFGSKGAWELYDGDGNQYKYPDESVLCSESHVLPSLPLLSSPILPVRPVTVRYHHLHRCLHRPV